MLRVKRDLGFIFSSAMCTLSKLCFSWEVMDTLSSLKGTVRPYWTYKCTLKNCFLCPWMNTKRKLFPVHSLCNTWYMKKLVRTKNIGTIVRTLINQHSLIVTLFKILIHKVCSFTSLNRLVLSTQWIPTKPSLKLFIHLLFCNKRIVEIYYLKGKAYIDEISKSIRIWISSLCLESTMYFISYHHVSTSILCIV